MEYINYVIDNADAFATPFFVFRRGVFSLDYCRGHPRVRISLARSMGSKNRHACR